MKKVNNIFWLGLVVVGILLRLIKFGQIPTSLNRDEAALGYNAFAIANYGVDEWNQKFPLVFKSFGDYKLPGYIYFLSILIRAINVNDVAIRLPSLMAGIWIIWITFLLLNDIAKKRSVAVVGAAMVAVQPWAIFYSRMAYEANLGLALFLTSILLGIKYLKNSKITNLLFCGLFYAASILTYNSPLLLAPVLIVFLLLLNESKLRNRLILIGIIILIAGLATLALWPVNSQKKGITVFSDPTITHIQMNSYSKSSSIFNRIWWNNYIYRGRIVLTNIYKSFDPRFLVTTGGANPWHSTPGKSHIFAATYVLFFATAVLLIRSKKTWSRKSLLILVALVGSLLPAAVTVDAPHATRSLFFLWLFTVVAAYSLTHLKRVKLFAALIILVEIIWWSNLYYFKFAESASGSAWPVGLSKALTQTTESYNSGKEIIITDEKEESVAGDQLYIFPLLYYQVDPVEYNRTVNMSPPDVAGMIKVNSFNRISLTNYSEPGDAIIIQRGSDGKFRLK